MGASFAAFGVFCHEHGNADKTNGDEREPQTPPHFVREGTAATVASDPAVGWLGE
jgi:hypothetical protein